MNLTQAIRIAYKSAAVAYASCRTRHDISQQIAAKTKVEKYRLPHGPDRVRCEVRQALWENYAAAQSYALAFCDKSKIGAKTRLTGLWVQIGNDVADLPDWDAIASKDLKAVASFKSMSNARRRRIQKLEREFAGNSDQIPTSDFETQFEEMLDLFAHDLWAAEGMRMSVDEALDRAAEGAADLAEWDSIMDGSRQFFEAAMERCCAKAAVMFRQYLTGDPQEAATKNKYKKKVSNRYKAVDGLFALDLSKLSTADQQRAETKRVKYR